MSKAGKNIHLTHINDTPILGGVEGTRDAIQYLLGLHGMLQGHTKNHIQTSTKFDGAPAIICGINPENGKFFVGTKGAFAKSPKLNYTNADIDRNHPGEGLAKKLKIALRYLPKLGIPGIFQGDMMYTSDDLKKETIEGIDYITFRPNTITYAVPIQSNLAAKIIKSKMGIVFHTEYRGDTIASMKASYSPNIGSLNQIKDVWFRDANIYNVAGTATFTAQETAQYTALMSSIGQLFRTISSRTLNYIASNAFINVQILAWTNSRVRAGSYIAEPKEHVRGLIAYIRAKMQAEVNAAKMPATIEKRKTEMQTVLRWYTQNSAELEKIFQLQNLLVQAKNMVIQKLNVLNNLSTFMHTSDGYKATSPEGFVVSDILKGNAYKLVDQLTFSNANFNAKKTW